MHIDRETASAGRRRRHMAGRAGRGRFRRSQEGRGASETALLMGIVSTVEETLAAALRSATELDEGKRRHRRRNQNVLGLSRSRAVRSCHGLRRGDIRRTNQVGGGHSEDLDQRCRG